MTLTRQQKNDLIRRIERRRLALVEELRESSRDGVPANGGGEPATALLADIEAADDLRDLRELRSLEAARKRLKEERYGICIDCASDIPYERLQASPAALRCTPCEKRHEKTFASTITPRL
jgi:RNA polymerase-binding transcription factor DksA